MAMLRARSASRIGRRRRGSGFPFAPQRQSHFLTPRRRENCRTLDDEGKKREKDKTMHTLLAFTGNRAKTKWGDESRVHT